MNGYMHTMCQCIAPFYRVRTLKHSNVPQLSGGKVGIRTKTGWLSIHVPNHYIRLTVSQLGPSPQRSFGLSEIRLTCNTTDRQVSR